MSYLTFAHNPSELRQVVAKVVDDLLPIKDTFDVIAFTGMSGALLAPIIAYELGKPVWGVRKEVGSINSHSEDYVEGPPLDGARYIILDDFVSSGDTIASINTKIKAEMGANKWLFDTIKSDPVFVGVYGIKPGYDHIDRIEARGWTALNPK